MTLCIPEIIGADPYNIVWNVVRGDTATLKIEFYETNETDLYDTTGWTYVSTAYDAKTDTSYTLTTAASPGYVVITAPATMTDDWGVGSKYRIAELELDLQVTFSDLTVWTPVRGTISVISDITGGAL